MFSKDKTQRLASDSDWAFWNDNPMKVNYYNISQPWRVGGDVCNSYLCLFTLQLLLNTAIQLINNCGVILFAYPFYVYFKSELFQDPPCYSSILLVFPRWKHRYVTWMLVCIALCRIERKRPSFSVPYTVQRLRDVARAGARPVTFSPCTYFLTSAYRVWRKP